MEDSVTSVYAEGQPPLSGASSVALSSAPLGPRATLPFTLAELVNHVVHVLDTKRDDVPGPFLRNLRLSMETEA